MANAYKLPFSCDVAKESDKREEKKIQFEPKTKLIG